MKKLSLLLISFSFLFLFVQPALTQTSTIQVVPTRHITIGTENNVDITLNYSFTENVAGLIVTEIIPSNFKYVTSISTPSSSSVKTNVTANEIKWLYISLEGKSEITIQYTLETPSNFNENAYTIEGYWSAIGTETEATGTSPTTPINLPTTNILDTITTTQLIGGIGAISVAVVIIVILLARRRRFPGTE